MLRPLTEADIPALVAGLAPFEVSGWLTTVPHPYAEADARAFLDQLAARPGLDGYGIHDARGLVGVVGISDSLGYWIAREAQGRGYATEAAAALVRQYFATTEAAALRSGHFTGNHASQHVLAKLGFVPEAEARVKSVAQGMEMTLEKMILTREAWEARDG